VKFGFARRRAAPGRIARDAITRGIYSVIRETTAQLARRQNV
jgi:hypothetical protein